MADQQAGSSNAAQIEFWNSAASRAWADQHERMDRAVTEVTKALLERAAPQPGERALDIGCGGGTTVLELATRVGPAAPMSRTILLPGPADGLLPLVCDTPKRLSRMSPANPSDPTAPSTWQLQIDGKRDRLSEVR